ncbi:MAG: hypothetical protein JSS34_01790 [Proteobacteria bacterium]|nr:hypothetical protein [Pseudomonadota bacterium]
MKLKIVFLGNHTVGVQVLKALYPYGCLSGVVAHPEDPEDGNKYLSVHDYANELNVPVIRASPKMPLLLDFINKIKPDLIWVTDYKYLLPSEIFLLPRLGAINLHPSLLPKFKGRASLNWAMIHGENKVGLTAHFIDADVDTGDIIKQVELPIHKHEYIGDVLEKIYPLYRTITNDVITMFLNNNIQRKPQNSALGSIYPARKPADGVINLNKNAYEILNFIRALSRPYPGAFLIKDRMKTTIWKANISEKKFETCGLHSLNNEIYLQCTDHSLKITDYTITEESFDV